MGHFYKILLVIFLVLYQSLNIAYAQKPLENVYSISVKQGFRTDGACGDKPYFEHAIIKLQKKGGTDPAPIKIGNRDRNKYFNFNGLYRLSDPEDITTLHCIGDNSKIEKISVQTYTTKILNDKHLNYFDEIKDMHLGENKLPGRSASDPCDNFWGGGRESYTQTTTVFIDGPVYVSNPQELPYYKIGTDVLTLNISNYAKNGNSPVLEVALKGTENWKSIDGVTIIPGGTVKIPYNLIAGNKWEIGTNYFNWIGKNLEFRIVKTLKKDGVRTYGNKVAGVTFYPEGIPYTITHMQRSSCGNSKAIIYVEFDDMADCGYINSLDPTKLVWKIELAGADSYNCTMEATNNPLKFKVIPQVGHLPKDPFDEPGELKGVLQLDVIGEELFASNRDFTVPPKPDPITITQAEGIHDIETTPGKIETFHLLSDKNPYVVLNIIDMVKSPYSRTPYKIFRGRDTLATIHKVPDSYNSLTAIEKKKYDDEFDALFDATYTNSNEEWGQYFTYRYNKWYRQVKDGALHNEPIPKMNYSFRIIENHIGGGINGKRAFQLFSQRYGSTYYYGLAPLPKAYESYGDPSSCNVYYIGDINSVKLSYHYNSVFTRKSMNLNHTSHVYNIDYGPGKDDGYSIQFDCERYTLKATIDRFNLYGGTRRCDLYIDKRRFKDNGNYNVYCASNQVMVVHDKSDKTHSRSLCFLKFFDTGKVTEKTKDIHPKVIKITNDGVKPILSKDGSLCLYTPSSREGLYMVNITNAQSTPPKKISSKGIRDILYIDDKNSYCIYRDANNKVYQLFFNIPSRDQLLASTSDPNYIEWRKDFKNLRKKDWLQENFGYRLFKGVKVNTKETLTLIDSLGCDISFDYEVKVPKQPDFSSNVTNFPSSKCSKDGSATIKYDRNGIPPYKYSGGTVKIGDTFTVNNLAYGDNLIDFFKGGVVAHTCTITVSSTSKIKIDTRKQTSRNANGELKISFISVSNAHKTYTLVNKETGLSQTKQSSSQTYSFNNLLAGNYKLNIKIDGCADIVYESIVIDKNIFQISSHPQGVNEFSGLGSVLFTTTNRNGKSVIFQGAVPTGINKPLTTDSDTYTGIKAGAYSFTASVKDEYDRIIEEQVRFTIDKPSFEAEVYIDYLGDRCRAQARLIKHNSLVSDAVFSLTDINNNLISSGINLDISNLTNGDYKITFACSTDKITCYSFSVPGPVISAKETIEEVVCPGQKGNITITPSGGFNAGAIHISVDGTSYSTQNTFSVPGGDFNYKLRDKKVDLADAAGNSVTVYKTTTKYFKTKMPEPLPVMANTITPNDITCFGDNNGTLQIGGITGGNNKTNVQFRVDVNEWINATLEAKNLGPGEHTLYIKDVGNNCPEIKQGTFTIQEPKLITLLPLTVIQPTCELSNGSIQVDVSGGTGLYSHNCLFKNQAFVNSNELLPDTIIDLGTSLTHGLYQLTVTDGNNCSATADFTLNPYTNPQVETATLTDVRCFGETNGQISVSKVNGSGAFNYVVLSQGNNKLDSISDLSLSFDKLAKGNYGLSVVDVNGCRSNSPYPANINEPEKPISLSIENVRPVIEKGTSSGVIAFKSTGGNKGYKHIRLFDQANAELQTLSVRDDIPFYLEKLAAGQYTISTTDGKGCAATSSTVDVKEPDVKLGFRVLQKEDARCKAQTGRFVVEGTGGWGNYSYKRATDESFYPLNTFNHLYAGRYLVSVKDAMGAVYTDTVEITEPKDKLQTHILQSQLASCTNNGAITIRGQGGTSPYKFVLDQRTDTVRVGAFQNHVFNRLSTGSYLVKNKDANGCRSNLEVTFSDEMEMKSLRFYMTYPNDATTSNGVLKAIVEGGRTPFTYQWKKVNGSTYTEASSTLSGLSTGFYELTVTDAGGCALTQRTFLPAVNDHVLSIINQGDETGWKKADGFAELSLKYDQCQSIEVLKPDGLVDKYTRAEAAHLFNAQSNLYLNQLAGGDYHIVAYKADGRQVFKQVRIAPYEQFMVELVNATEVSRKNGGDGAIKLSVKGGASPYVFEWKHIEKNSAIGSNSQHNVSVLDKLIAGTYQVHITDKYHNTITEQVEVKEPLSDLVLSIKEHRNESCKTYQDAYVTLQASGGWGDYQFRHDKIKYYINNPDWRNLDVRQHTFYLTDKKGTLDSIKVDITEPDFLHAAVQTIDSVNCKGNTDGEIAFNITGGTAPYRFDLNTKPVGWQGGALARQLTAGHHVFYFTDTNNCVGQDTLKVYMPEPDELLFKQTKVTHTTCNTDNGSITVGMQGGSAPYLYEWRNINKQIIGQDSTINNLAQNGYYRLDVYDYHQCHQEFKQTIKPSTIPVINSITTTPVLCYGDNNGTATVTDITAAVPFAPYHFVWSNGQKGEASTGWLSKTHHVTVVDTNQCESTKYFTIDSPEALRVSIKDSKNAHCYGYDDGFIEVLPYGGVGAYQFNWSNGDQVARADTLSRGEYELTLTDDNACVFKRTFTITEPDAVQVDLGEDIRICPGNTITVDGQDFTAHQWSNAEGVLSKERFIDLSKEDDYYLQVTNQIGCFAHDTIALSIGNDALKADFLLSSEAYLGDTLRVYELSNMELDSLNWEYSGKAFANLNNAETPDYILHLLTMENGMYNVRLQAYSGGCVSEQVKQVEVIDKDANTELEDNLGYQEPLIQSLKVAPNPNSGKFSVIIGLREQADVELTIYNVNQAIKVDSRKDHGLKDYEVSYQLGGLSTGVYLLVVTAENERKQVKMIIK